MKISLLILPLLTCFVVSPKQSVAVDLYQIYRGETVSGVDTQTLSGKVMCGYQGWFNTPNDGSNLGWVHWGRGSDQQMGPEVVTIDLWPDVSEYDMDELHPTGFLHDNGSPGMVFSSYNRKTVLRHFEWMREYGIDGAFVQRFANGLKWPKHKHHKNVVLAHSRAGANQSGRAYAVMYDLSGLKQGDAKLVCEDWKELRSKAHITKDSAYIHHEGRPVVAVWGVGFNDNREYTLEDCRRIIQFLKDDGCTVMIGVPTAWRTQGEDAVKDKGYHEILKLADILSPWSVGRYDTIDTAREHAETYYSKDLSWCQEEAMDYLPVIFPGFSWHNLHRGGSPLGQIPRLKGRFMWEQIRAVKESGCEMLYVAMFDEVDEATAIFKCTNNPPRSNGGQFLDYEGLPSDYYLRLTGHAGKVLRGEVSLTEALPIEFQQIVTPSQPIQN
jgi:hypothetical protein